MAYVFGVGTLQVSGSGGTYSIGKLQKVSINITYEQSQLRGDTDVFPANTQFYDGKIDGSFDYGDIQLSSIGRLIGGTGVFAGAAGSGTITLTGESKPGLLSVATRTSKSFKMILSGVTNGVTSTVIIQRVFIPSLSLDFSRTDYAIPSMNFICENSTSSGLMKWTM